MFFGMFSWRRTTEELLKLVLTSSRFFIRHLVSFRLCIIYSRMLFDWHIQKQTMFNTIRGKSNRPELAATKTTIAKDITARYIFVFSTAFEGTLMVRDLCCSVTLGFSRVDMWSGSTADGNWLQDGRRVIKTILELWMFALITVKDEFWFSAARSQTLPRNTSHRTYGIATK